MDNKLFTDILSDTKICVVGLGYVGLPLACAFSEKYDVIGFDISKEKIDLLKKGQDPTGDVENLSKYNISYTSDPSEIKKANFIVVAVPTPIDSHNIPDLKYVKSASELVGKNLSKGTIVVYESTVYPGVTKEVAVPLISSHSGLESNKDFKTGYSPERINPGDKEHTVDKIVKVVSGSDEEALKIISKIYGSIITAGVHEAPSIKVAEAAKVIENIQRDLNIALMNELSIIFDKLNIDTKSVIDAAGTKWNFHKYTPGLVGGHCIGVDPYYLTFKAEELGYRPEIILAGRRINDTMHKHVVELVLRGLTKASKTPNSAKVLIMGLTFKENVNDFRNSRAKQLIQELKKHQMEVFGYDPLLTKSIISESFDAIALEKPDGKKFDAIILVSPHKEFDLSPESLMILLSDSKIFIDIKSFLDKDKMEDFDYYRL